MVEILKQMAKTLKKPVKILMKWIFEIYHNLSIHFCTCKFNIIGTTRGGSKQQQQQKKVLFKHIFKIAVHDNLVPDELVPFLTKFFFRSFIQH